jgi:hypothetical protein
MGWVVSVRPRQRFTSGKGPSLPIDGYWLGPRAGLDTDDIGKSFCFCRESNLYRPIVQSVVGHYTDWATLALILEETVFANVYRTVRNTFTIESNGVVLLQRATNEWLNNLVHKRHGPCCTCRTVSVELFMDEHDDNFGTPNMWTCWNRPRPYQCSQWTTCVHYWIKIIYPMSLQMKFQGLCLKTELHNVSKRQVNIYYLEDVLKHASPVWRDVGHSFAALRVPLMFTARIKHLNTAETRLSRPPSIRDKDARCLFILNTLCSVQRRTRTSRMLPALLRGNWVRWSSSGHLQQIQCRRTRFPSPKIGITWK